MALVLSLYDVDDDDYRSFYLNDTKVSLEKVKHGTSFQLRVHGSAMDHLYNIGERHAEEISKKVFVSAGNDFDLDQKMIKVNIDAPKHIKVLRAKLYKEAMNDGTD